MNDEVAAAIRQGVDTTVTDAGTPARINFVKAVQTIGR